MDALLDWEDELPQADLSRAEWHSKQCEGSNGVALCLGTSLQMCPARDLPCQADKMVIVNLQPTVKDEEAWLVVRAKIDDIMYGVMKTLDIPIPVRVQDLCIRSCVGGPDLVMYLDSIGLPASGDLQGQL